MAEPNSPKTRIPRRRLWRWGSLIAIALFAVLTTAAVGVGVHLENNDRFCASCHTEPETTYVNRAEAVRAQTAQPTDLASFHSGASNPVACIDCHSGPGVQGRASALELGATDLVKYVANSYPQPAPLTQPITDEHCLKCHQDYAAPRTFQNHFHVFLARWQRIAPGTAAHCVDCHSAHTTDQDTGTVFLNQNRTATQCNACHRVLHD